VGASIGGLSAANVLNRLGAEVVVFESFPHGFHERGGALGSVDARLLERIRGDTTTPRPIAAHGHFYGDLCQYLWEGLPSDTVCFGVDVEEIVDATTDTPTLMVDGTPTPFDLVIGADGGRSSVRITSRTRSLNTSGTRCGEASPLNTKSKARRGAGEPSKASATKHSGSLLLIQMGLKPGTVGFTS
tara:strand:- start:33587 stop:34147 length:561 start_codon:yes stop_codon:yes gene_type:complete